MEKELYYNENFNSSSKEIYLKSLSKKCCTQKTVVSCNITVDNKGPFKQTSEGKQLLKEENDDADLQLSGHDVPCIVKIEEQFDTVVNTEPVCEVNESPSGNVASKLDVVAEDSKWCNHFPCEVCGKVFKWQSHLKKHFLSHSGEKPYSCILCGKSFSQSGSLKTHLLKHSGIRPYICQYCGKTFTESGKLNNHIMTHTGEKPFPCALCSLRFPTIGNLKKHAIVHMGVKPYVCDECGKGFGKNDTLKKHMTVHTGERPYKCNVCDKSFGFRSAYRRHINIHVRQGMDT